MKRQKRHFLVMLGVPAKLLDAPSSSLGIFVWDATPFSPPSGPIHGQSSGCPLRLKEYYFTLSMLLVVFFFLFIPPSFLSVKEVSTQ